MGHEQGGLAAASAERTPSIPIQESPGLGEDGSC
jgi:hypothetical protein